MITFRQHRLPNGLTILGEMNPAAHSFAAGIFVRAGSRDEPAAVNGVSHFLEHMMFKGSSRLDWQAMNRVFDEMGARYNAFTTQEMTAYYGSVLPTFTTPLLKHLRELFEPAIRTDDFDTEKKVILEEIAMYNDEPGQKVFEKLMAVHFEQHPLAPSVIGTAEIITAMTREQMSDYFQAHYGPEAMVLSMAGKFDFDHAVAEAERLYGHWAGTTPQRDYPIPFHSGQRVAMTDPKLSRAYAVGMMPGPSAQDEDRFAARVLADIVGESDGSRFYWALVDNALCEDADFGFYPHDRTGSFYVSLQTSPERVDEVLSIAQAELARVRENITDDEVLRATNKLATTATVGGESPMSRMRGIGANWLYTGEYRSVEDDLATLASLDRRAIDNMVGKYPFDPMTIVTLSPVEVMA